MMSLFLVYALRDPRDGTIRYIGQSTRGIQRARASSRAHVADGPRKAEWIRSLNEAGGSPEVVVLQECVDRKELDRVERRWIQHYRALCVGLTNMADGGPGIPGVRRSVETRAKQSAAARARGISSEQRARMNAARRGKPLSAAHRDKIRAANLGRKMLPEVVEKSAAKRRGRKMSDAVREKNRQAHLGQVVTDEHRAKISRALKGRAKSHEWRTRMSALRLQRFRAIG